MFVEPESVVEAANRLSDAQAAENREINVVLADAARGLRWLAESIAASVEFTAQADLLQAKARLVANDGWTVPRICEAGPLRMRGARHPLLLQKRDAQTIVPLDVALGEPHHLLVVTGPNTGGKTVVLKTLGLLALMARCAVPIPAAAGAQIPFAAIQADIGDAGHLAEPLDLQFARAAHRAVHPSGAASFAGAARRAWRWHGPGGRWRAWLCRARSPRRKRARLRW